MWWMILSFVSFIMPAILDRSPLMIAFPAAALRRY